MAITHVRKDYDAATQSYGPEYTVTEYEGRVLEVFKQDYRAMSDVYTLATYARVVTDAGSIDCVMVNANFECDLSQGHAVVDATPQAIATWDAHKARLVEDSRKEREAYYARLAAKEHDRPVKGKRMVVLTGRKHKGYEGTVSYVKEDSVLLKHDREWEDRKAQGVWVNARHLRNRDPMV